MKSVLNVDHSPKKYVNCEQHLTPFATQPLVIWGSGRTVGSAGDVFGQLCFPLFWAPPPASNLRMGNGKNRRREPQARLKGCWERLVFLGHTLCFVWAWAKTNYSGTHPASPMLQIPCRVLCQDPIHPLNTALQMSSTVLVCFDLQHNYFLQHFVSRLCLWVIHTVMIRWTKTVLVLSTRVPSLPGWRKYWLWVPPCGSESPTTCWVCCLRTNWGRGCVECKVLHKAYSYPEKQAGLGS